METGTTQSFSDEAVPTEDLNTIMEAGLAAASAINQQPWYFVAVTNKDVMDQINAASGSSGSFSAGDAPANVPENAPDGDAANGTPEDVPADLPENAPTGDTAAASDTARASLRDSPAAIIIYEDESTMSPDPDFDCGLAAQNMYIAAVSLGYGAKLISSPTMNLNGDDHDTLCDLLGVDHSMQAVAVLLIGKTDVDAVSNASTRSSLEEKTTIVE